MGMIIGGSVICVIAVLFFVSAVIAQTTGKELPIFKLFVAKSRGLWKEKVYIFYIISGILMFTCGIVMATNSLW